MNIKENQYSYNTSDDNTIFVWDDINSYKYQNLLEDAFDKIVDILSRKYNIEWSRPYEYEDDYNPMNNLLYIIAEDYGPEDDSNTDVLIKAITIDENTLIDIKKSVEKVLDSYKIKFKRFNDYLEVQYEITIY